MIKTKKTIYDPKESSDGKRILVMRLWPRGVSKDKIDMWLRDLGTDPAVIKRWKGGEMTWQEFTKEYTKEMKDQKPLLHELAEMAKEQDITLLCSCKDEKHCHRTLLKAIVESLMKMP